MDTIGDSTDPQGTLRPNLSPEPTVGTHFKPLICPPFDHSTRLPSGTHTPLQHWNLFITEADIDNLLTNTNARAAKRLRDEELGAFKAPRSADWYDVSVGEMYVWLGILVLISIHPEHRIESFWTKKQGMGQFDDISGAMGLKRWQAISRNFHISNPEFTCTVFDKVIPKSSHFEFRRTLGLQLILYGNRKGGVRHTQRQPHSYPKHRAPPAKPKGIRLDSPGLHYLEKSGRRRYCAICEKPPNIKRKTLGDISNSRANSRATTSRKKVSYHCTPCKVPVCKFGTCFDKHIQEVEG
jgi:hypothetical protein